MKQLICPVSNERINERITRLNALFGILLVVSGFMFNTVFFFVFLLADFYIRAFTNARYSPISLLSSGMVSTLNLEKKDIDKAPKIFAARLGFLMTAAVTLLFFFEFNVAALIVGGILVFFSSLEFALGICMGCIIYTYVITPFYK